MSNSDLDPHRLAEDEAVYRIVLAISTDIEGAGGVVPLGVTQKRIATSFPVKEGDDLMAMAAHLRDHVWELLVGSEDFYPLDDPEPGE